MMKKTAHFLVKLLSAAFVLLAVSGCAELMQLRDRTISSPQTHRAPVHKLAQAPIPTSFHHIVLLLPLSGEWAASSNAIHNGFLAAHYEQPAEKQADTEIKVLDTSGKNTADVYRQAVTGGADIIVGPLTKPEVAELTKMGGALPVPTLALNTLDDYQNHRIENLYQFGLLPQDEAQQAALKMLQDGHQNVALVVPASAWGQSVAVAFQDELSRHGGQVIDKFVYASTSDADLKIQQFLHVERPVSSTQSAQSDNKNESPHYRSDISAVFVISDPNNARQIVPLLKFYTQGKLPVYATSRVYGGFARPVVDQDLEDVTFCDMPWVITDPLALSPGLQSIRSKVSALWPESLQTDARLYALGIDAYMLMMNFNRLVTAPQVGLIGATGTLRLDNYNHIYRQLPWATMKQGMPKPI